MQNTHSQKIQHVLLQHDKTRDLFYHSYMDTQNTATLGPLLSSGIILERTGLQNYQTMVVTHSPQVTSKGNYHYLVEKKDINNKTTTSVKELNNNQRIEEIADRLP